MDEIKNDCKAKKSFFCRRKKVKKQDFDISNSDVVALIIAGFQVFMPIFAMIGVIIFLLLLFITKVWFK
ncbi:hypothetical protein [Clostridium hydrogenum]|uniref:hypothetical protein n=1 Tax=Clostridium hydrogenum TaxID=2855764 RepID=UPI001F1F6836|nr:hypothetical protein [Clostridium hydrogenum]